MIDERQNEFSSSIKIYQFIPLEMQKFFYKKFELFLNIKE